MPPQIEPLRLYEHLKEVSPELQWHIVNDVTALLAPYMRDDAPYSKTMLITVSSGIGSKLFDPVIGVLDDVGYAGEIGHSVADPSAEAVRCDCGGRGHLAGARGR